MARSVAKELQQFQGGAESTLLVGGRGARVQQLRAMAGTNAAAGTCGSAAEVEALWAKLYRSVDNTAAAGVVAAAGALTLDSDLGTAVRWAVKESMDKTRALISDALADDQTDNVKLALQTLQFALTEVRQVLFDASIDTSVLCTLIDFAIQVIQVVEPLLPPPFSTILAVVVLLLKALKVVLGCSN